MKYDAIDIANYIVQKHIDINRSLTNLKLQKLLYFAWIAHFIKCNEYLFDDKVYAWKYGPFVRNVYREYSIYGGVAITSVRGSKNVIDKVTGATLDAVIERYRNSSGLELVKISCVVGSAWYNAYEEGRKDKVIEFRDLEIACNSLDSDIYVTN